MYFYVIEDSVVIPSVSDSDFMDDSSVSLVEVVGEKKREITLWNDA